MSDLPPNETPKPDPNAKAAYALLAELLTTMATQRLPYQHGVEAKALESLVDLFKKTRAIMEKHEGAERFSTAAARMLNNKLRPVTAKWHPLKEQGVLDSRDGGDEFRADLKRLQNALVEDVKSFHQMAYGSDWTPPAPNVAISEAELSPILAPMPFGIAAQSLIKKPAGPDSTAGLKTRAANLQNDDLATLENINENERTEVDARRRKQEVPTASGQDAVGLAFSGGGIRSATFCLGVAQVLAEKDMLKEVDFLSTVSGGGYTGSFLTQEIGGRTPPEGSPPASATPPVAWKGVAEPDGPDTASIRRLRQRAKFLTARSLWDAWGMVTATVAGMIMNWVPPLMVLTGLAILTLGARWMFITAGWWSGLIASMPLLVAFGVAAAAVFSLRYFRLLREGQKQAASAGRNMAGAVLFWLLVLVGMGLHGVFSWVFLSPCKEAKPQSQETRLGCCPALSNKPCVETTASSPVASPAPQTDTTAAAVQGAVAQVVAAADKVASAASKAESAATRAEAAATKAEAAAAKTDKATASSSPAPDEKKDASSSKVSKPDFYLWKTPEDVLQALYSSCLFHYLGLFSFGALVSLVPVLLRFLPMLKNPKVRIIVTKVALVIAAVFVPLLGITVFSALCAVGLTEHIWEHGPSGMVALFVLGIALTAVGVFCLNINVTGPHRLYRDGLSKTFVEPSEDGDISYPLTEINKAQTGPYHLINAALNLPTSQAPVLRERKCDFFLFSKHWTGSPVTGYQRTSQWQMNGRPADLGTAMAISGAAFSANMGLGSIAPLRALLAFLNVRLGFWIPQPQMPGRLSLKWKHPGFFCLLREMTGLAMEERHRWLNLSDGGHIENLAIYELLRRRCKFIIAVDGEADPDFTFQGLMTLVRHAQIDLGVRIESDLSEIRPGSADVSRSHYHLCKVHYPEVAAIRATAEHPGNPGHPGGTGLLLYIKLSVTGNEGELIKRYRTNHLEFPHQTTLDQFFDEEQFEAYRELGVHVAKGLFAECLMNETQSPDSVRDWFTRLAENLLSGDPLR